MLQQELSARTNISLQRFRIERDLFIDNLLVRIHFIIVMIRWTGLARLEFVCQVALHLPSSDTFCGRAALQMSRLFTESLVQRFRCGAPEIPDCSILPFSLPMRVAMEQRQVLSELRHGYLAHKKHPPPRITI